MDDQTPPALSPPTESTALLARTQSSRTNASHDPGRARRQPISPVLPQLQTEAPQVASELETSARTLDSASQTSLVLVSLLYLRKELLSQTSRSKDIWGQWYQEERCLSEIGALEERAVRLWCAFARAGSRTEGDLEKALWEEYVYDYASPRVLRAVDLLGEGDDGVKGLLADRLLNLSLLNVWKYGRPVPLTPESSVLSRTLTRARPIFAPRVLYTTDLLLTLLNLLLLAHFLLHPPNRPIITYGPALLTPTSTFLTIYSFSSLLRPRSSSLSTFLPSLLILLSFLYTLPSLPFPEQTAFSVLLFAFVMHVALLHFPRPPSPVFLFSHSRTPVLPLAALFEHVTTKIFSPALLYFLPALLFSTYLLSASLSDRGINPTTILEPASLETRFAFLALLALLTLLFLSFLATLTLHPTTTTTPTAQRAFLLTLTTYSVPHYFPPPLNLLQVLLVKLPAEVLGAVGRHHVRGFFMRAERALWCVCVAPLVLVVAGLWGWGLAG